MHFMYAFHTEPSFCNALRYDWSDEIGWELPFAIVCVSVKWWENFVGVNRFCIKLKTLKKHFHYTRIVSNTITSGVNIPFTIASMFLLEYLYANTSSYNKYLNPPIPRDSTTHRAIMPDGMIQNATESTTYMMDDATTALDYDMENSTVEMDYVTEYSTVPDGPEMTSTPLGAELNEYFQAYTPGLVCVFASLLAYYLAGLACKLKMQPISFAIPVVFSTPLVICWMIMKCQSVVGKVRNDKMISEFILIT